MQTIVEWKDDPAKYKRRIRKTLGYEFKMNEMKNPNDELDVWEFSNVIGPRIEKENSTNKSDPAQPSQSRKQEQVLADKAIDIITENPNISDLDLKHDLQQIMTNSKMNDDSKKRKVREAIKIVKASSSVTFNQKEKSYKYK